MKKPARYPLGGIAATVLILELIFWGTMVPLFFLISRFVPKFRMEAPDMLWWQLAGPVLILLFLLTLGWRNRAIRRFGEAGLVARLAPGISGVRATTRFLLLRLGFAFAAFSLCGPQLGTRQEVVEVKGVDVIVALDVSNSMLAEDLKPNRMESARRALEQLIGKLHGDRLGIVVFAGQAFTQLPLTSDRSAARLFLGNIGPDMIPVQGTAIGAAIRQAQQGFDPNAKGGKTIIIITDGENHEDDAIAAAREAAAAGITVNTVGMGDPKGAPLPLKGGGFRKDQDGNTITSKLNIAMLQEIAAAGNGAFVQATQQQSGIQQLVDDLHTMEASDHGTVQFTGHEDHFQWFLAIGCLLIFAAIVTAERTFTVPVMTGVPS